MALEASLKYSFTPREVAERKLRERKMNVLLLIQQFLKSEGYIESYNQLVNESKLPKDYEICDNMDFNNILQDYETYYFIRFQKYPKISKKICKPNNPERKSPSKPKNHLAQNQKKEQSVEVPVSPTNSSFLSVQSFVQGNGYLSGQGDISQEKLFRPLGSFEGYSDEWKSLAEIISRDIVEKNLNVNWDDVVGLNEAKMLLKEAIVYPMRYPQMYEKAIITPWRGLLLYGPSGTGKTLLAKAVASECCTTFFNISASSIVSKWRGDSEKLVRVMFDLARLEAPSTIFVDELDAIASRRDNAFEHEASRRLKSELLIQLDGLCQGNDNVFFLATSNLPWDLDIAVLRRLEKRIFIGLPELQDREKLIEMYLPPNIMTSPLLTSQINYQLLAQECDDYSGADIELLCKEVKMAAVREIFNELERGHSRGEFNFIHSDKSFCQMKLKPILNNEFRDAKLRVKPSISNSLERYILWRNQFGS